MHIVILANRESGTNRSQTQLEESIRSAFAEQGEDPEIQLLSGPEIKPAAEQAVKDKPDVIVAAGGDGTLHTVAEVLSDSGIAFGILRGGTLNHFAKDLNIPPEMDEAAAVICKNHVISVDLGSVNGHYFLNNSSIGAYPWAVKVRDSARPRTMAGKWLSMARAWGVCFYRFPLERVKITIHKNQQFSLKTPFIFIGNNQYKVDLAGFGHRQTLSSGKLCLYTSRHQGRSGLPRLAWSILRGRLHEERDFEMHMIPELKIESETKELSVALDGEVELMDTPLKYSIHPGALRVIVPEKNEL